MTNTLAPTEFRRQAGIAGALYLIVVISGGFTLLYVPSRLFVSGNAAATAQNILESITLFRQGILAGMICYVAFLVLPLALYTLLAQVHRTAAILMVTFAVASVPMSLLNLSHKLDIVSMLSAARSTPAGVTTQVSEQVMQSLDAYRNGVLTSEIFWGLWLLPFGYLVYKSGTIPRVLGVFLMLGCVGYVINVSGTVLVDGYESSTIATVASVPSAIGELGTCLWLLLCAARGPRRAVANATN